jgi:hypothetical protein
MTFMQTELQQPNRVAAVFQNAAIFLKIAHRTTFAQLAEQLSRLAEIHGQLMCPVQVRVADPLGTMPLNNLCIGATVASPPERERS